MGMGEAGKERKREAREHGDRDRRVRRRGSGRRNRRDITERDMERVSKTPQRGTLKQWVRRNGKILRGFGLVCRFGGGGIGFKGKGGVGWHVP